MKFTGHCDYKSIKPYIDIAEKAKTEAMAKIAASWEEGRDNFIFLLHIRRRKVVYL